MPMGKNGQYHYEEADGKPWTFMWQTINRDWPIERVLLKVRNCCVQSTNTTQNWCDTLHAIGETKMYSITIPMSKDVDVIAAEWITGLLEMKKIKYYRAMIIVKARPSEAKGEVRFVCHAALRGQMVRMTVQMEPRIRPEKPAPIWTVKDTAIDVLDAGAAKNERAVDPAVNLLHDCVLQLGPWEEFNLEVPDDSV